MTSRDDSPRLKPLTKAGIEGPKKVLMHPRFEIAKAVAFGEREQRDFKEIIRRLGAGESLEPFYRRGIGTSPDKLLVNHQVMHLHLNGKGSNTLLYLIQYPDHVVLLCVDSHIHVDDIPPGKKFPNDFKARAAREVAKAMSSAQENDLTG